MSIPITAIPDDAEHCQALEDFYTTYGATTIAHKIANLERELGRSNMYGTNQITPVSDDQRLVIYEHQWKVAHGFIHPIYA